MKLEMLQRKKGRPIGAGLRMVAEEIASDVRRSRPGKGVPKDKGILAASIEVQQPQPMVVQLVAGGQAIAYALVQHERLDFHHELGEARYLVRGMERWTFNGSSVRTALTQQFRSIIARLGADVKQKRSKARGRKR